MTPPLAATWSGAAWHHAMLRRLRIALDANAWADVGVALCGS